MGILLFARAGHPLHFTRATEDVGCSISDYVLAWRERPKLRANITLASTELAGTYLVGYGEEQAGKSVIRLDSIASQEAVGPVALINRLPAAFTVGPDTKIVSPWLIKNNGRLSNVRIKVDTLGGRGLGSVSIRPVVYTEADELVAEGDEVVMVAGLPARWVSFTFRAPLVRAGTHYVGLHVGGNDDVLRLHSHTGGRTLYNGDLYEDGASLKFGPSSVADNGIKLYLFSFPSYVAPVASDTYYGRLPFVESQAKLSEKAATGRSKRVKCGWHHLVWDEERGSFALVSPFGPLANLAGHRVWVQQNGRRVVASVRRADERLFDPISLTRRLFAELGGLPEDFINVDVWDVTV